MTILFLFMTQTSEPNLEALRKNMIDRVIGWKKQDVKMHLDDMVCDFMRELVSKNKNPLHGHAFHFEQLCYPRHFIDCVIAVFFFSVLHRTSDDIIFPIIRDESFLGATATIMDPSMGLPSRLQLLSPNLTVTIESMVRSRLNGRIRVICSSLRETTGESILIGSTVSRTRVTRLQALLSLRKT